VAASSSTSQFDSVFATLKPILDRHREDLHVKANTASEYRLVGAIPSPFPQHKGAPMDFASVRQGKAYVSFHLMALYMNPALNSTISPELKKRMQGKTCFNFKTVPDASLIRELERLTETGFQAFRKRKWI
jgi:hypothetical protein